MRFNRNIANVATWSSHLTDDDITSLLSNLTQSVRPDFQDFSSGRSSSSLSSSPASSSADLDFRTHALESLNKLLASRPLVSDVLYFCRQSFPYLPGDTAFRSQVYDALAACAQTNPDLALPVLLHHLSQYQEPELENRLHLVDLLGDYLGYRPVLDKFIELLDIFYEHSHEVVELAIRKLSIVAPLPKVHRTFLDILKTGREPLASIRENMLSILEHLAPVLPEVAQGLKEILAAKREPSPHLRSRLLHTLCASLPPDEMVDVLNQQTLLTHELNASVRLESYELLGRLLGPAALSRFVSVLLSHGEPDATCQMFLLKNIQSHASTSLSAVNALHHIVSNAGLFNEEIVTQAALSLAVSSETSPPALQALQSALASPDVRKQLMDAGVLDTLFQHLLMSRQLHKTFRRLADEDHPSAEIFQELIRCIDDGVHLKFMPSTPPPGLLLE